MCVLQRVPARSARRHSSSWRRARVGLGDLRGRVATQDALHAVALDSADAEAAKAAASASARWLAAWNGATACARGLFFAFPVREVKFWDNLNLEIGLVFRYLLLEIVLN